MVKANSSLAERYKMDTAKRSSSPPSCPPGSSMLLKNSTHSSDEQLKKLQTSYIDFYLLHALDHGRWRNVVLRHHLLARAAAALADGRIRHLGFSFHGDFAAFEEILNGSDLWTFCQIQYNYIDIENQAGTRGLEIAAAKGLAVVVMEPLMGGRLADPPPDIREAMDHFPMHRSPARWALDWLWDQPEVCVVLSGMSTMNSGGGKPELRKRLIDWRLQLRRPSPDRRGPRKIQRAHRHPLHPLWLLHALSHRPRHSS